MTLGECINTTIAVSTQSTFDGRPDGIDLRRPNRNSSSWFITVEEMIFHIEINSYLLLLFSLHSITDFELKSFSHHSFCCCSCRVGFSSLVLRVYSFLRLCPFPVCYLCLDWIRVEAASIECEGCKFPKTNWIRFEWNRCAWWTMEMLPRNAKIVNAVRKGNKFNKNWCLELSWFEFEPNQMEQPN